MAWATRTWQEIGGEREGRGCYPRAVSSRLFSALATSNIRLASCFFSHANWQTWALPLEFSLTNNKEEVMNYNIYKNKSTLSINMNKILATSLAARTT
jgi:hypothetical protein